MLDIGKYLSYTIVDLIGRNAMKLSTRSRYGLRVCFLLGVAGGTVSLTKLREQSELSLKYLEQLMIKLRKAGIVDSARGMSGGYSLSKPASEISVGDILDAMDDNFEYHCNSTCRDDYCPNKRIFKKLSDSIHDVLQQTSLQNMIDDYKCV